jgi:biopolymer transport protein TolR
MLKRRMVKPEFTFINLIDVMLVLLIIFMMAAPTIQQWVDVDLPSAKVSKSQLTEGIVVSIAIEKDKQDIYSIFIDKDKIKFADFSARFEQIWKERSGEPVFIRADGNVPYKYVMDVIAIAKKLGGENVGLVVEEDAGNTLK